ncbi:MAG: ABC transporter permease [Desulfacinum sp.]|nr:ABC transporter permease [Desulfacinum sp.]
MTSLLKRLVYLALVLWGVSLLTFGLFALAPGDPAEILLRDGREAATRESVAELRRELGLDDPVALRYARWLGKTLRGDLGRSWQTGEPVAGELLARLGATLELASAAFVFVVLCSVALGVVGAVYRGRAPDHLARAWCILCLSLPNFWLGPLLIMLLALRWGLLPIMGRGGLDHLIMPALTLGLSMAALEGRVLRASLLEILGQDYVRFALAKGLTGWAVMKRHVLRNALPPVVTLWGISLGHLLGGAVIVESIFSWPGLGKLAVDAVLARDVPLVQGTVLLMALVFVVATQLTDLAHRWLDPRLSHGKGRHGNGWLD